MCSSHSVVDFHLCCGSLSCCITHPHLSTIHLSFKMSQNLGIHSPVDDSNPTPNHDAPSIINWVLVSSVLRIFCQQCYGTSSYSPVNFKCLTKLFLDSSGILLGMRPWTSLLFNVLLNLFTKMLAFPRDFLEKSPFIDDLLLILLWTRKHRGFSIPL